MISRQMAKASLRVRLLAAILAPLLALGILEGGLRVVGYRYDPYGALARAETYSELGEARIYVEDPELIWKLRPSTVLDNVGLGFVKTHTNSLGLRGPEPEPEEGDLRVLCLGDSITFGLGNGDAATWPAKLRAVLSAKRDGKVVVLNGGVPGWSSVQGQQLLERLRSFRPDAVVFWYGMNDSKAARGLPDSMQVRHGSPLPGIVRAFRGLRIYQLLQRFLAPAPEVSPDVRRVSVEEFAGIAESIAREFGDRAVFVRSPERIDTTIAQLREIIRQANEAGVRQIFGPFDTLIPWTPAQYTKTLKGELRRVNGEPTLVYQLELASRLTTIDDLRQDLGLLTRLKEELDDRLATLPEGSLGYEDLFGEEPPRHVFNDNCHLTPVGAELAAKAIAEKILKAVD
jgi:lysophospholipase L1-like esterase